MRQVWRVHSSTRLLSATDARVTFHLYATHCREALKISRRHIVLKKIVRHGFKTYKRLSINLKILILYAFIYNILLQCILLAIRYTLYTYFRYIYWSVYLSI